MFIFETEKVQSEKNKQYCRRNMKIKVHAINNNVLLIY